MRVVFSLLIVFISQWCTAQKGDTIVRYLDKGLAFTTKANMVYSAVAFPQDNHWVLKSIYPDNILMAEVHFLDKKLTVNDGPFIINYAKGLRAVRGTFRNNYRVGVWQSWYPNGQVKDSGALVNDVLIGTWLTFYNTGKPMTKANFNEQVGSTGLSPLASSGNRTSLLSFPEVVAIKTGLYETWYSNGFRQDSGNYQNDVKKGLWKAWFENGKPESEGTYGEDEMLVGDWTFYREDGSISTKEKYVEGKLNDLQCYDEKGTLTGSFCSIAKPPVLLGTPVDWKEFFERNLLWSKASMKSNGGEIAIRFTIGKDGKLANHTIQNSPGTAVTEDIEKVISRMKDWSPAILHNRPLEYSFDYALPFYPR